MSLYLSGPISSPDPVLQAQNIERFHQAAAQLRAAGYDVVNPCENDRPEDTTWQSHMRADIKLLMGCDGVAMLTGWVASKGARIEWQVAHSIGLECHEVGQWLRDVE